MPIYMKLTSGKGGSTIVGEARDAAHRGWIALDSFSWGNGGSSERGSDVHDVVVTTAMDRTSPQLMRESMVGMPGTAVIEFVDKNGSTFLRVTLEGTLISGYKTFGGPGTDRPAVSFTLNFTKATQGFMSPSAPDITTTLQSILKNFDVSARNIVANLRG